MAILKTDYKDDILDTSQNTKRKYAMTENQDNTVSFDDETEYTQEGDSFGAQDINATNIQVNTNTGAIADINDNLTDLTNNLTWDKVAETTSTSGISVNLTSRKFLLLVITAANTSYNMSSIFIPKAIAQTFSLVQTEYPSWENSQLVRFSAQLTNITDTSAILKTSSSSHKAILFGSH